MRHPGPPTSQTCATPSCRAGYEGARMVIAPACALSRRTHESGRRRSPLLSLLYLCHMPRRICGGEGGIMGRAASPVTGYADRGPVPLYPSCRPTALSTMLDVSISLFALDLNRITL